MKIPICRSRSQYFNLFKIKYQINYVCKYYEQTQLYIFDILTPSIRQICKLSELSLYNFNATSQKHTNAKFNKQNQFIKCRTLHHVYETLNKTNEMIFHCPLI